MIDLTVTAPTTTAHAPLPDRDKRTSAYSATDQKNSSGTSVVMSPDEYETAGRVA